MLWGVRQIGLFALLLTAGCGGVGADVATAAKEDRARLVYTVSYELSADVYDETKAEAALSRCTSMDGAREIMTKLSLPPHQVVGFAGERGSEAPFEDCLRTLPDTRLSGPREITDPNDAAFSDDW